MENIEQIKHTIIKKLQVINPNKIILFGSYAYGTPTEDSDLDICIIEDEIISKIKEKKKIRELLKDINISKDILLVDENYYQTHSDESWINTALYDIKHKGILLYEKN